MSRFDDERPPRQMRETIWIPVAGMILEVREKALKFSDGDKNHWLPLSTVRGLPEVIRIKVHVEFEVAEWIAKQKGLI